MLLPGTVTILIPIAILTISDAAIGWGGDGLAVLPVLLGLVLVVAGLALWRWTVRLFARVGRGTLSPWDPTRHLVVEGPYRHVRNPMITAVLAVLAGETLVFGSLPMLVWTLVFFAANHVFFLAHEEPGLVRRFGDEYRAYRDRVPRWLPRRTPWTG